MRKRIVFLAIALVIACFGYISVAGQEEEPLNTPVMGEAFIEDGTAAACSSNPLGAPYVCNQSTQRYEKKDKTLAEANGCLCQYRTSNAIYGAFRLDSPTGRSFRALIGDNPYNSGGLIYAHGNWSSGTIYSYVSLPTSTPTKYLATWEFQ